MAILKNEAVPEPLQKALQKYGSVMIEMGVDPELAKAQVAIDKAQEIVDHARSVLIDLEAPYMSLIGEFEMFIEGHVLELESSAQVGPAKATFTKAHERVSYDRKSIEKICLENPALNSMLSPARKVTPVDARVSVKFDASLAVADTGKNGTAGEDDLPF